MEEKVGQELRHLTIFVIMQLCLPMKVGDQVVMIVLMQGVVMILYLLKKETMLFVVTLALILLWEDLVKMLSNILKAIPPELIKSRILSRDLTTYIL